MESPLLTAEDLITQGNKAMLRKDWQEAVRLYALLREKFPEQPDGYVGGAAALRALGDFESVDALMLEGLKKFPKDAALYVKYGDSAMRRKDWPEAAKRWALMRKKCPRKPHGYFKGAAALKEQGNFDAADALVLEGLEKFPAEPCLHIEYGEVATRQKKWAEAARRWALMREKCPENPRGYVSGVEALKESRNFESADALALEGLEKFPQEPELYIQYGDMAARKKDFPEASRRWALMREKCPRHPRGYTSGVAVLKIQGEFKAAEDLVLAGLKKFPKEPGLYIQYGDIAMRRKNWPEASRRWALMREKCPRHPRGYTDGAKSLAEQEEFEAADALIRKGLKKIPQAAGLLYAEYGNIAMRQLDWPEASRRWTIMRKKCPQDPQGYVGGAAALKEQRDCEAADTLVREGMEKFPQEASLYAEYGNIAMRGLDWPEAARRWALLREKCPYNPLGYFFGAMALKKQGEFEAATSLALEGLEKFPGEAKIYIEYGDVAMYEGDYPTAAKRWALMREKCPENPQGYFYGAEALKEQGEFEAAEALVLEGLEKFPEEQELYMEYGDIAMRRRDWKEADRRWALMRRILADDEDEELTLLPDYFECHLSPHLDEALESGIPIFLYVPKISMRDDALIPCIQDKAYRLEPLSLIKDTGVHLAECLHFSENHPVQYKNFIRSRLIPLAHQIKGMLFDSDLPSMARIMVDVCAELGIPTILMPDDSTFIEPDAYYRENNKSIPACDEAWCSGKQQRDIFVKRGYPENRIRVVGLPVLDQVINYKPLLTREQFCRFYGFDAEKPVILFMLHDSDNNADKEKETQMHIVSDIANFCERNDVQLLLRQPPNGMDILGETLAKHIQKRTSCFIEYASMNITPLLESIYHASCVISIDPNILFRSALMKKNAIFAQYGNAINSKQIGSIIHQAKSNEEISCLLTSMISDATNFIDAEMISACEKLFGVNMFDGRSSIRVRKRLANIACGYDSIEKAPPAPKAFEHGDRIDFAVITRNEKSLSSKDKYMDKMLNINTLVSSVEGKDSSLQDAQIFFEWGSNDRRTRDIFISRLNKPIIYIESGFINIDIGNSNVDMISIIYDSKSCHYDGVHPSQIEDYIQNGEELDSETIDYCRMCIDKITSNHITKYNKAPIRCLDDGNSHRKRILLVDQKFGDRSIQFGMSSPEVFGKMLDDALNTPDCDIIIKTHPDAIRGGQKTAFNRSRILDICGRHPDKVMLIDYEINPYCLFDIVDEVWVCTSGMGFEALMAGKKVRCYGMPFYAGWGLTEDMIANPRRSRKRTLEEVFYYAYIYFSRYYDPDKDRVAQLHEILDYIIKYRERNESALLESAEKR